jgi:hypothetical protein
MVLSQSSQSFEPVDFDFLLKWLKFGVAGDEFSLLFSGQRGGEGIGQTELETRFEIGGAVGQGAGGGMKIDGQALQDLCGLRPGCGAVLFHNLVLRFGVVNLEDSQTPTCALGPRAPWRPGR